MPENRFYHSQIHEKPLILEGDEMRHLLVMRPKVNEEIELVDGAGHLAKARIHLIKKNLVELSLTSIEKVNPPPFLMILAQGIPKLPRLDNLVEKGTELGMSELWLFAGDFSEKAELSPTQEKRIQHLMIASLKQCGRLYLPKYFLKPSLLKWERPSIPIWFGDLRKTAKPIKKIWEENPPEKGVIFVVGPEKGLSEREIEKLESLGAIGVSLHENILRTDTAPIVALSIIGSLRNSI